MTNPADPPSQSKPPLSTGSMSTEGTTNIVRINQPGLNPADKKVLCSAICKCKDTPGVGKDGRSLKQMCVSNRLKGLDETLKHRSPYKPEVNYDMTKQPPAPIMDREVATKGHSYLPGWINKWWSTPDEQGTSRPEWKAGQGYVRRPDVVIVNDPTKPPTQDNISKVVEIKFQGDGLRRNQKSDYELIAGDKSRVVVLGPDQCDCDRPEPEPSKIPVEQLGAAAAASGLLYFLLTKRPPPVPVPVP